MQFASKGLACGILVKDDFNENSWKCFPFCFRRSSSYKKNNKGSCLLGAIILFYTSSVKPCHQRKYPVTHRCGITDTSNNGELRLCSI